MTAYSHDRRSFLAAGISAAVGLALQPALGESQDLAGLTLKKASELLRRKTVSSVDLTQVCLDRISRYNPRLNAFITVTAEQALAMARQMDAERQRGNWRGSLHGIPIALKDNIDTAGIRTTAASELFADRVPSEDAEVVRRLKAAGAIVLGKLNLHEFAYGGTSDVSYFGPVRNPWALDHMTGGSSGGSAAAMAANLCFGTLGTDTAGSIRNPASYCGVVGLKPTYGRVSLHGVIPLAWSLDHIGPICKTVEDAAVMLAVIAGYDPRDPASIDVPVSDYTRALGAATSRMRVGIPRAVFFEELDPQVAAAVETALGVIRKMTASVTDITLPPLPSMLPILVAEAYAYHARWIKESPGRYQPFTRDRLLQSAGAGAAEYADALHRTHVVRREITDLFSRVDVLVTPTMPGPADAFAGSMTFDPRRFRNTAPFDVLGLPTISVSCGFTTSALPIGLQITGAPFAESTVLALAHAYERATDWHSSYPKLNAD